MFLSKKSKDRQAPKELKEKDSGKKSQFYVEFLGWMECRGVRGRCYTDPAIRELKRRQKKMDSPPKLTLQLTARELKISQDFEEKKSHKNRTGGGSGIKKVTFPPILARDITYVVQAMRDSDQKLEDVVACIFLGYMPRTGRYVHVHVYRFDEPSTAATFTKLLGELVAANTNRINEVERELADKGEIDDLAPLTDDLLDDPDRATGTDSAAGSVSGSGGYSDENGGGGGGGGKCGSSSSPTFGSDDMDADLQSLNDVQPFDSVAEELKYRLRMNDGPLLLPPKDYDTISRARGNLRDINQRRCRALNVVGEGAMIMARPRNGSDESGIDLASPESDGGDVLSRFSQEAAATSQGGGEMTTMQQQPYLPTHSVNNSIVYPPRPVRVSAGDVYPPRPERVSAGDVYPPRSPAMSPAMHRTASQRHAPINNGERRPEYSRSNSSSSNNNLNNNPPVSMVQPLPQNEDLVPPTDYDEDSFNELVTMHRPGYVEDASRPRSSTQHGGSPMLMRSLPAKLLKSEMALHRSQNPRQGMDIGDEYFFNAQRISQSMYASHSGLDVRPRSAEVGSSTPRRVNSYR